MTELLKAFIAQFTKENIVDFGRVRAIGNDFFLVKPEIAKVLASMTLPPLYAGQYLGRFQDKLARPSLDLLQLIAKTDAKKVVLNDKGAWMFVCRRPALAASIVKNDAQPHDVVLVLNQHEECIGYGAFDGKNVKNFYDIGDFLRRERHAKRA